MTLIQQYRRFMYLDIIEDRPLTAEEVAEKAKVKERFHAELGERNDILCRLAVGNRQEKDVERLLELELSMWGEKKTDTKIYDVLDEAERVIAQTDELIEQIKAKLE